MKIVSFLVSSILFFSVISFAEIKNYGPGSETCGSYVRVRELARSGDRLSRVGEIAYHSWFKGFATKFSIDLKSDVLKKKGDNELYLWLENHCKANPLKPFLSASLALLVAIGKE
jgi:hypothetical protein